MATYRVVLADDHLILRKGLIKIIEDTIDIEVIAEARDGIELLEVLKKIDADMVILDISMPKLRGIEAAREIKKVYQDLKIMILTMHKNPEHLYHALAAGVEGYLIKEDTDKDLIAAINKIRNGQIYVSPTIANELTGNWQRKFRRRRKDSPLLLTLREMEVLKLVAEGCTNKEIASLLFVSKRTIDNHRANILKKLNIKTTTDLIRYAIRNGYITNNS